MRGLLFSGRQKLLEVGLDCFGLVAQGSWDRSHCLWRNEARGGGGAKQVERFAVFECTAEGFVACFERDPRVLDDLVSVRRLLEKRFFENAHLGFLFIY